MRDLQLQRDTMNKRNFFPLIFSPKLNRTMRNFLVYLLCALSIDVLYAQAPAQTLTQLPSAGYAQIDLLKHEFITRSNSLHQPGSFCYQITRNESWQNGGIWWPEKISLAQNFRMDFVLFAGNKDASGADGFAFVMQNHADGTTATGLYGQGLGFGNLFPSLAIEIDTYRNGFSAADANCLTAGVSSTNVAYTDPADDHLALVRNGAAGCPLQVFTANASNQLQAVEVNSVDVIPNVSNIERSDICPRFVLVWDYISPSLQRIRFFVNGNLRLMREDNFINDIFAGVDEVWWGYTGATGNKYNEQTVCLPTGFGPPVSVDDDALVLPSESTDIDVLSNDLAASRHPRLWLDRVMTNPTNGVATIDQDNGLVTYRSNEGYVGTDALEYRVCDGPDATRCYTICATATVNIQIGCPENRILQQVKLSDDVSCDPALASGAIEAQVTELNTGSTTGTVYEETFLSASDGATNGSTVQGDGQRLNWSLRTLGSTSATGVAGLDRYIEVPPGGDYEFDYNLLLPAGTTSMSVEFRLSVVSTGQVQGEVRLGRVDVDGAYMDVQGGITSYAGYRTQSNVMPYSFNLNTPEALGRVGGPYVIRFRLLNGASAAVSLKFDDIRISILPSFSPRFITDGYTYRWHRYNGSVDELQSAVSSARDAEGNVDMSSIPGLASVFPDAVVDRNTPVVNQLAAGVYIGEARFTAAGDGCSLVGQPPVEIEASPSQFEVQITEESPVTNCVASNGVLSAGALVNGGLTTDGYEFSWFETSEGVTAVAFGARAERLSALSYTVSGLESNTGCVASESHTVSSSLTTPVIRLDDEQDITSCVPGASGSARVSAGTDNNDYRFEWFNGELGGLTTFPGVPDFQGAEVDLPQGYYTVRAVEIGNSCASEAIEIYIEDISGSVDIRASSIVPSSNCLPPFNGSLVIEASYLGSPFSGDEDTYSINFYSGGSTTPSNVITSLGGPDAMTLSAPDSLIRAPAGQYTVEVLDLASACKSIARFTIPESGPVLPVIDVPSVVVGTNFICSGGSNVLTLMADGSRVQVDATGRIDMSGAVTTDGAASSEGYLYKITSGSLGSPDFREDGMGIFEELSEGTYTLNARDSATRCDADSRQIRVEHRNKFENIEIDSQVSDTECQNNDGDGQVTFTFRLNAETSIIRPTQTPELPKYSYDLYRGLNSDPAKRHRAYPPQASVETITFRRYPPSAPAPDPNGGPYPGLQDGVYRIVVRALDGSNCFIEEDVNIVDEPFNPTYAGPPAGSPARITPHSSCRSPNGSIQLNLLRKDGTLETDYTQHNIIWSTTSSTGGASALLTPVPRNLLAGIREGLYFAVVTNPNRCRGTVRSFSVPDRRVVAGVDIVEGAPLTACAEPEADGILSANITSGGVGTDFSYEWFKTATLPIPATLTSFATGQEASPLWEGNYAVRVTHTASGCAAEATESLNSTREAPIVTLPATVDNTSCVSPYNGSASIEILYGGSVVTDFTGFIVNLDGTNLVPTPTVTALKGLSLDVTPGHVVRVTRRACEGMLTIPIRDQINLPDISGMAASVTENTSCNEDIVSNGRIRVAPAGSSAGAGYSYVWYNQRYTTPTANLRPGASGNEIDGLRSGTYAVAVTNDVTGCASTRDFVVSLKANDIDTDVPATVAITDVTNCNPHNGRISVSLTDNTPPSTGARDVNDFEWKWYMSLDERVSLIAGGSVTLAPGQANGLSPGNYSFRYIETATACESSLRTPNQVNIDASVLPVFTTSNPVPAQDCMGSVGTGRVTITGPSGRTFDVNLYRGDVPDLSTASSLRGLTGLSPGPRDIPNLTAGVYTTQVIDGATRCFARGFLDITYRNAPTVVEVINVSPSNCAPYTDGNGFGGRGGASGTVTVSLIVDEADTHNDYQLFLYASTDVNQPAVFSPLPVMERTSASVSGDWAYGEGRPEIIQSFPGHQFSTPAPVSTPIPGTALGTGVVVGPVATQDASTKRWSRDYIFAGLAGNTDATIRNYLIVAAKEREAANCVSTPVRFNVPRAHDELVVPPLTSLPPLTPGVSVGDNVSCGDPNTSTGSITIQRIERNSNPDPLPVPAGEDEIDDTDATLTGRYEYTWRKGPGRDAPTLQSIGLGTINEQQVTDLPSGIYSVTIKKDSNAPNTGDDFACENHFVYAVGNTPPQLSITAATAVDLSECVSSATPTPQGSITVNQVTSGSVMSGSPVAFSVSGLGGATSAADYRVVLRNSMNEEVSVVNITPSSPTDGVNVGQYTLFLQNTRTFCQSAPYALGVGDARIIPTIDVAGTTIGANANCNPGPYNGVITLAYSTSLSPQPAGDFGYRWYEGSIPSIDAANPSDILPSATGSGHGTGSLSELPNGVYSVVVTHSSGAASGCRTFQAFSVPDEREYPNLAFEPGFVTHNTSCVAGNGELRVPESAVTPDAPTGTTYQVALYRASTLPSAGRDAQPLSAGGTTHSPLNARRYYVRAENPMTGCHSAVASFEVEDNRHIPEITDIVVEADKGCTGSLGLGSVSLVVVPQLPSYTYDVEIGATPPVASGALGRLFERTGMMSGDVPIKVTNVGNGCIFMTSATILRETPAFRIEDLSLSDQTHCSPWNGSAQLLNIHFNGATTAQLAGAASRYGTGTANFVIAWNSLGASPGPVAPGNPVASPGGRNDYDYERRALAAGEYEVTVTQSPSGCGVKATFRIADNTSFPVVFLTQEKPNESCKASDGDGILVGTADGNNDHTAGYAFEWYRESTLLSPTSSVPETSRLENQKGTYMWNTDPAGRDLYRLKVRNETTGCDFEQSIALANKPLVPEVPQDSIAHRPVTKCAEPFDGSIDVLGVSPGNLGEYTVTFYDSDPSVGSSTPIITTVGGPTVAGKKLDNLSEQSYYFQLKHSASECTTPFYEVRVEENIVLPEIVVENIVSNTRCNDPYNGEIGISVLGFITDPTIFNVIWDIFPPPPDPFNLTGLSPRLYTVEVENNFTACKSTQSMDVLDESINPLEVVFQSRPNTRCVKDPTDEDEYYDGVIIADVSTKLPGYSRSNYLFVWSNGTQLPLIDSLSPGSYAVTAFDLADPACSSALTRFELENATIHPEIEIETISPLTYCDPNKPNAILAANIPADLQYKRNYSFIWFVGASETTDTLTLSYKASNLSDTTQYTVKTIRTLSGCSSTRTVNVPVSHAYPDPPLVILNRARTDCEKPNGKAEARIKDGREEDYTFSWFKQDDLGLRDTLFHTALVEGLDEGTYVAYITSKETGCPSLNPVEVTVPSVIQKKEFRVESTPSLCTEGTGSANIIPIDPINIKQVTWVRNQDEQTLITAPSLLGVEPGSYKVSVTSEENCVYEQDFEIGDKILPYNGVSANADGLNDFFHIDCIELYPDNMVEIYDRDGNLVFAQAAYNNSAHVFVGQGNRGLYVGGKELPDGTYYYVITKGGDSLMMTGYLELIH